MLGGETSFTGIIRNAIGGADATRAAAATQSNGFYTFGSVWAGGAAEGFAAPTAALSSILKSADNNPVVRVGPVTAGTLIRVSIGASPKHWARYPAWAKVAL